MFSICNFTTANITALDFKGLISLQINNIVITGCVSLFLGYLQVAFCAMSAERQIRTIRQTLFRSILQKEIGYFDKHKSGELTTKLADDVNQIRDGIGDKISITVQFLSSFIAGLIIGNYAYIDAPQMHRGFSSTPYRFYQRLEADTSHILSISINVLRSSHFFQSMILCYH
jgi:ABC-type multidrug transport system fused ATPase/permease subunit